MVFVIADVVIIAICLHSGENPPGTNPRVVLTETSDKEAYAELTYCGYYDNENFFRAELVYKGLLIALACTLSFLTRKVAGAIAGSKALMVIVYNTAFMSGVIILITNNVKDVESTVVCECLWNMFLCGDECGIISDSSDLSDHDDRRS